MKKLGCSNLKAFKTERVKHTRKTALVFDLLIQHSVLWKKENDLCFNGKYLTGHVARINFRPANSNQTIALYDVL